MARQIIEKAPGALMISTLPVRRELGSSMKGAEENTVPIVSG